MNRSIPFPDILFEQYLKEFHIAALEKAPLHLVDMLFKRITDDFRNERISLDDFSTISNEIYSRLINLTDEEWSEDDGLKSTVEMAAELSYRVRHPDKNLLGELESIISYPDYTLVKKSDDEKS